uniref:Probable N-acetyltransferase 14 n=1 Tax=Erpetoichthys calabaricus TaxID=27687 RepID=A0A8C4T5W8_ERPCA
MSKLDPNAVLVRLLRQGDTEIVTEILKDTFKGAENRLILYLLTRPCALLLLAISSSALRFLVNSFIAALVLPVFVAAFYLKLTIWRLTDNRSRSSGSRTKPGSSPTCRLWVAEWDGEILGCVARDLGSNSGQARLCRLAVSSWHRREGVGALLVREFERQAKLDGYSSVIAHVSVVSKVGVEFFKNVGYTAEDGIGIKGWLGYPISRVYVKML